MMSTGAILVIERMASPGTMVGCLDHHGPHAAALRPPDRRLAAMGLCARRLYAPQGSHRPGRDAAARHGARQSGRPPGRSIGWASFRRARTAPVLRNITFALGAGRSPGRHRAIGRRQVRPWRACWSASGGRPKVRSISTARTSSTGTARPSAPRSAICRNRSRCWRAPSARTSRIWLRPSRPRWWQRPGAPTSMKPSAPCRMATTPKSASRATR